MQKKLEQISLSPGTGDTDTKYALFADHCTLSY